MIGSQDEQEGVITLRCRLKRGDGHRRSGVASHRFEQDRARFYIDLAHLLGHDEAVVLVADQQWFPKRFNSG
jgi:hypothetical protein